MDSLISIIIPTYNSDAYLKECLDSVKKQTYKNIEVIIIDGGSTDFTHNISRSYCNNNKNWRLIITSKGVSHQRNVGLDNAKGEFIYFLDSDDYLSENLIQDLYSLIDSGNYDIVSPTITKVFYVNDKITKTDSGVPIIRNSINKNNFFINAYDSYLGGPTKLYKTKMIGNTRFNEKISLGEDLLFNYEIACRHDFRFTMSKSSTYFYRFIENRHLTFESRMNKKNYLFCPIMLKIIKKIKKRDENYYGALFILRIYIDLYIKSYLKKHKLIPIALANSRIYLFMHTNGNKKYFYIFPILITLISKIRNKNN